MRTFYVVLVSLLMGLIIINACVSTSDKPYSDPKWLPLGYYDYQALQYLGDVCKCWPEDDEPLDMDTICDRLDRLNDYIEAHHEFLSRGIQIYIQDRLVEIGDENDVMTLDHEPIPVDMFAED